MNHVEVAPKPCEKAAEKAAEYDTEEHADEPSDEPADKPADKPTERVNRHAVHHLVHELVPACRAPDPPLGPPPTVPRTSGDVRARFRPRMTATPHAPPPPAPLARPRPRVYPHCKERPPLPKATAAFFLIVSSRAGPTRYVLQLKWEPLKVLQV